MLTSSTLNLLNFVFGVVIGIYLPLASLSLFSFFRKTRIGFRLILAASLRLLMLLFGFFLVIAALGLSADFLQGSEKPEEHALWLGLGIIVAFLAGTVLFLVGLWKARAQIQ
jgi:hypothetical protein